MHPPDLSVPTLTKSGLVVKEEMEKRPQVEESFSLEGKEMASGVTHHLADNEPHEEVG